MPQAHAEELTNNEIQPNNNQKSKSKKRSSDPLISAAHTIACCIDFNCNVDNVIKNVQLIQQDEASKHGELDEDDTERQVREEALSQIPPESREHIVRTYYKILQIAPTLKAMINDPTKSDELASICIQMNGHIKAICSTDASHLKSSVPRYALPDSNKPNSLDPPIVTSNDQAEMGLNHLILAHWLCPVEHLESFDEDPAQARKDLASGVLPMVAENLPSLFWSGERPGDDFDPNMMYNGLFCSYFLVWVGRHIFLGLSHALQCASCCGRSNNAILHGMTTVEAEHIAYICVQAHFIISSMSQWNEIDSTLNYVKLYAAIVQFIRDAEAEWRNDLLKWWNMELFDSKKGHQVSSSATTTNSNPAPCMSMMDCMHTQMQAHRAAQTSQPQAANGISESNPAPADDSPLPEAPVSTTQLEVPMSVIDPSLCPNHPLANDSIAPVAPRPSAQVPVIPPSPDVTRSAQLSTVLSGPSTVPTGPPSITAQYT